MSFSPPTGPAYHHEERPQAEEPGAEEGLPGQGERFRIHLEGAQADTYLEVVRRLIRGGRLNQSFPNPTGQDNLYRLMAPKGNFGLDNRICINDLNGLPSEPDIGRVLADKESCQRFLTMNDNAEVLSRTDEASLRLHKRIHYYRDIAKSDLPRRVRMDMKLKAQDPANRTARFITVFERYDPGEGVFTRYTIDLIHQHTRWSKPQVEMMGDDLLATEAFRNIISRYNSDEAEFAFVLLSDVPGIQVMEVMRRRIGPLWFKDARTPPEIAELLEQHPGEFIMNFPFESVSVASADKNDIITDPYGRLFRTSLSPEAQEIANRRAEQLEYRVVKERKFSCTPGVLEPFRQLLADRKARCVVNVS